MRNSAAFIRLLATVSLAASVARAGHPAATDDAGTVRRHATEVEFSTAHERTAAKSCFGAGVALRGGLHPRGDAGVALTVVRERGASACVALDTKWRLMEGHRWSPSVFVRADATVEPAHRAVWDGLATGATWTFAAREISLETAGVAAKHSVDALVTGIVWIENVAPSWSLVLEAVAEPFVQGRVPHGTLVGLVRHFDDDSALSVGLRHGAGTDQGATEWSVGWTR